LTVAQPATAREQLIRAAARQFVAGDVQHWWLPPAGQGVRTRIADDRVWLPFAVAHYIEVTGDLGILEETVPFLDGPELHPGQDESFFQPTVSEQRGTIFEHCARALDCSLAVGIHGIPLFGSGDWNDGMNHVGEAGKGNPPRGCARIDVAAPRNRACRIAGARRMGRQLVSARLLRRRHGTRLGRQSRMPNRFDRAVVERNLRRRKSGPGCCRDGGG
jgi:hypothetical protein